MRKKKKSCPSPTVSWRGSGGTPLQPVTRLNPQPPGWSSTTSTAMLHFQQKLSCIVLGAVQILCVLQEQVHYVEFEKLKTERAATVVHIHCSAPVFSKMEKCQLFQMQPEHCRLVRLINQTAPQDLLHPFIQGRHNIHLKGQLNWSWGQLIKAYSFGDTPTCVTCQVLTPTEGAAPGDISAQSLG